MRYRALTPTGDMTFGKGSQNFLINSPAMVAQKVRTRLKLFTGEWFLDLTEGTPWGTEVLGTDTQNTYDIAIRDRILETEGVTSIVSYSSTFNAVTRNLTVTATIDTLYGQTTITEILG